MSTEYYLKKLDWSSEIARASHELEVGSKDARLLKVKDYLNRGIARCFVTDKDGKYKEAIDDLSRAIVQSADKNFESKVRYYRAYAYYLSGDYANAITDCNVITKEDDGTEKKIENNITACAHELLGKIYFAMNRNKEAADAFGEALKHQLQSIAAPSIMDSCREACRRMNNV